MGDQLRTNYGQHPPISGATLDAVGSDNTAYTMKMTPNSIVFTPMISLPCKLPSTARTGRMVISGRIHLSISRNRCKKSMLIHA
jgi:hypothetical protein